MKLYRSLPRRSLLALGLLASCKRTPTHARVDPALAPLIPPDSTSLAGIRLDLLKKAPLWQSLGQDLLANFAAQSGMKPAQELYELVYCFGGRHRLTLLRGKWTNGGIANSGLEPELNIPGGTKLPYKGFVFHGREDFAVVFFNSSVALAGRAAALRDAIDARNAQRPPAPELPRRVSLLPHAAHIYMVSSQPRLPEKGLGGLKSVPFALESLAAWATISDAIEYRAEANLPSAASASEAAASLRGLLSLLPKKPDVQLTTQGQQLVAQGKLSPAELREALSWAE
ncbi:MAG: hypothetical protein NW208_08575 [Bryobacter sp.]|nr:hypothetical protein [Bryobacter sp.]